MTEPWQPLSEREAGQDHRPLVEGVPPYLYAPLRDWLYQVLEWKTGPAMAVRPGHESALTREVMIRLQLSKPSPWLLEPSDPRFLDAIDAALRWTDWRTRGLGLDHDGDPGDLERILNAGGSAWRVSSSFDGLERRVNETTTAAAMHTFSSAGGTASDHLRAAWQNAYGRNPNPDTAYREAVLAVEAVVCPLVSPRNDRATLGTVIRDLRNQAAHWELALSDSTGGPTSIEPLLSMLALLWQGQSRHAGSPTSRRQTPEEAEAAVHLAATLVQWIKSGVLRKTSVT